MDNDSGLAVAFQPLELQVREKAKCFFSVLLLLLCFVLKEMAAAAAAAPTCRASTLSVSLKNKKWNQARETGDRERWRCLASYLTIGIKEFLISEIFKFAKRPWCSLAPWLLVVHR